MEQDQIIKLPKQRFEILICYCALIGLQLGSLYEYAIIADSVIKYYDVSMNALNVATVSSNILCVILLLPSTYSIKQFGVRKNVIIGAAFLFLGSLLKCFSVGRDLFAVAVTGNLISAASMSFSYPVYLQIPRIWFPSKYLSTITSIIYSSILIGVSLVALIVTQMIPEADVTAIESNLQVFLFAQAAVSSFILLSLIVLVKEKPKYLPTATEVQAAENRKSLSHWRWGNKPMIKNFILVVAVATLSLSAMLAFTNIKNQIFTQFFTKDEALLGTLTLVSSVFLVASMIGNAFLIDKYVKPAFNKTESNNGCGANEVEVFKFIADLVFANVKWYVVYTSVRLNLIDHLSNEMMTSEKLAQITKTENSMLVRILRALVNLGLLERCDQKLYKVTKIGSLLQSDHAFGFKNHFLFNNTQNAAFANLSKCMETGDEPFKFTYGFDYWEYLRKTPDENTFLHDAVDVMSEHVVSYSGYDWKQFNRFIEIRCCGKRMITKILTLCPGSDAIVLAKDEMFEDICGKISNTDIFDRCQVVKGHFLNEIPAHGDCYIINFLLQDWTDENCIDIFKNIRRQMNENAKILIMDAIGKNDDGELLNAMVDIILLTLTNGKSRKIEEIVQLLKLAGFEKTKLINELSTSQSLLEASL